MFIGHIRKTQKTIEKKKCVHYETLYFGMKGFAFGVKKKVDTNQISWRNTLGVWLCAL